MYKKIAEVVWHRLGRTPFESISGITMDQLESMLEYDLPPLEVTLHYCMLNNGDGSASPTFFKTSEGAEARSKYEADTFGENFCDDVGWHRIKVDLNGNIIDGNDYISLDADDNEVYEP